MANHFVLRHRELTVTYDAGRNPALTALGYDDGGYTDDFKPADITTNQTELGELVSVPLRKSIDSGGETFGFFLPEIDVPLGSAWNSPPPASTRGTAVPTRSRIGRRHGTPSSCTAAPSRSRNRCSYSHSIVAGGLLVTSSTTRFTSGTSLVIRVDIRARTASGSRAQSAVIASSLATGRSTTG
jgi:hypothetical protein